MLLKTKEKNVDGLIHSIRMVNYEIFKSDEFGIIITVLKNQKIKKSLIEEPEDISFLDTGLAVNDHSFELDAAMNIIKTVLAFMDKQNREEILNMIIEKLEKEKERMDLDAKYGSHGVGIDSAFGCF